ncbi:Tetracycline resistance protein, TetA/multidrug resistance protein MdtG family and Major facilitator superfamily and Major facilitator superfamily domain, general substrate transporter and Major facilitator superfamily domain-containing protein [Strongyloides ratti]|uniref:MFS domain-containing protein n=1 Tax=Strongyloides ratti TaxID=34506 RepID=A0A090N0Q5_STRRB|nr:Tetracycline resistance protein, TetA/multidrug resistance protein MdtG family and Major facilitator superfamily and Major facilitator superfamily domain, general substrate transporter and Major facilitator superfamily domain-containing protein [Strongyloides ratti]CEF71098.1 Tetracycline resistance protein, TetA/multidrug resistance protein MdtG family and Major facilitator superfamily and Major facilitator superfamily domain, general substrate transporter and Major facilitator superfamily dom
MECGEKNYKKQKSIWSIIFDEKKFDKDDVYLKKKPRLIHVIIVIFLEYFSWGLVTIPAINFIGRNYPEDKFLINGLSSGGRGILAFIFAPILGKMTDMYGRKKFLFLTVLSTCLPIPCLFHNSQWYVTIFVVTGLTANSFAVANAYAADITCLTDRHTAYSIISSTFGASFMFSPFLGAAITNTYGDHIAILIATVLIIINLLYITFILPESLPKIIIKNENLNDETFWLVINEFFSLRKMWADEYTFKISMIIFLSNVPEAGQISCFFIFLRAIVGMSQNEVGIFIAYVGLLTVFSQLYVFKYLTNSIGIKGTLAFGLITQCIQLFFYGFCKNIYLIYFFGLFLSLSQMVYPSIASAVSLSYSNEEQGSAQALINGLRGLCSGIGPVLFGFIFQLFNFDVHSDIDSSITINGAKFPPPNIRVNPLAIHVLSPNKNITDDEKSSQFLRVMPGPPFALGSILVFIAFFFLVAIKKIKATNKKNHGSFPEGIINDESVPLTEYVDID